MDGKNLVFSKMKLLLFFFVLSNFFMGQIAFAEGDGSGGGQNQPLTLVSSSIADGATGVPLKPQIKLTFSKNIVNATTIDSSGMTVRDHNMQCFSMQIASGTKIPIDIYMADDQVDFEARNDAVITPKANLDPGTSYSVVVSKDLEGKNFSAKTGQEIRITFTTAGVKPSAASSNTSVTTPQASTAATASAAVPKVGTTAPAAANTTSNNNTTAGSQAAVQSSTAQSGTNTQTTTATETANSGQQQVANTPEKMTTGSKKGTKEVHKSKEAPKDQMKTSQSNSSFSVLAVSVLIILATMIIYLWVKKKKVKIFK